jgi:uncharacterized OsmC-like protein
MSSAHIRTAHGSSMAVGWAGRHTLVVGPSEQDGGSGLGYTGGELLLLAIGACFCNDLFREAAKRTIILTHVQVDICCTWGGEPVVARHPSISVRVAANASEAEIRDLIYHTDQVAEVPNTLRIGTSVTLTDIQAISVQDSE